MCRPCKWQVVHETVGELSIRSRASNHPSYEYSSPRRMWRNWRPLSVAVEKIATKNLGADQSQETTAENEFVAIWQWLSKTTVRSCGFNDLCAKGVANWNHMHPFTLIYSTCPICCLRLLKAKQHAELNLRAFRRASGWKSMVCNGHRGLMQTS